MFTNKMNILPAISAVSKKAKFFLSPRILFQYLKYKGFREFNRYYLILQIKLTQQVIDKPFEVVHVPLELIKNRVSFRELPQEHYSDLFGFTNRKMKKILRKIGFIADGAWDLHKENLDSFPTYLGFVERINDRKEWKDTVYYKTFMERKEKGTTRGGVKTWEEYEEKYLKRWDELYRNIQLYGYRSSSDMKMKPESEVNVCVTRDGEILLFGGGHRLSIAKILKLDTIPVIVKIWHKQYLDWFKDNMNHKKITPKAAIQPLISGEVSSTAQRSDALIVNQRKKPIIVELTGVSGVGKTFYYDKLKDALGHHRDYMFIDTIKSSYKYSELARMKILTSTFMKFTRCAVQRAEFFKYFMLWYKSQIIIKTERNRDTGVRIIDGGPFQRARAIRKYSGKCIETVRSHLFDENTYLPDVVILVDADPDTVLNRIKKRGNYKGKNNSLSTFQFDKELRVQITKDDIEYANRFHNIDIELVHLRNYDDNVDANINFIANKLK